MMLNKDLLLHIDRKFDELHEKINKVDKKVSNYWSNTIFQYILLAMVFISFVVYEFRFQYLENRVDNYTISKDLPSFNIDNHYSSTNSTSSHKVENNNSTNKKTSLFGN